MNQVKIRNSFKHLISKTKFRLGLEGENAPLKTERALRGAQRRGNLNLLLKEIATLLSVVRNDNFPRWDKVSVFLNHSA